MDNYVIKNGQLITAGGVVPNTILAVAGGRLAAAGAAPAEHTVVDAAGMYIAPGFIDLHVHGGGGCDTLDGSLDSLRDIAAFHARGGTTSWLPTLAPAPKDEFIKGLKLINCLAFKKTGGAIILGSHMEGPWLAPEYPGAINPAYLRKIDREEVNIILSAGGNALKMVTLAPELAGSAGLIKKLAERGVIIAAGHSAATSETAMAAFKAGVRHATHLFNATSPLHHRMPGLAGAVLADKSISADIIVDGYHLHPVVIRLITAAKGTDRLVLVTDAVRAAGMPDGKYLFNGKEIIKEGGRISRPGGPLAGSALTMIGAVKNMIALAGVQLHEAVRMASLNPARLLGLDHSKGDLRHGMDADLVLLDKDLNVRLTMVSGEIVYAHPEMLIQKPEVRSQK